MMIGIWNDVRYGLRLLRRAPGFTGIAVLMLALGIGVNAAVFCWIQTIVLTPLPGVANADRAVAIVPTYRGSIRSPSISYPEYKDLSGLDSVFSSVIVSSYAPALLTVDGQSRWIYGRVINADSLANLGVKPEKGRSFLPEEDQGEGEHSVLLISHALWQERFGADPKIAGRTLLLNQHLFTVVGVLPAEFAGLGGGFRTDFLAPLTMHNEVLNFGSFTSRTHRWLSPMGLLRAGVTVSEAQAAVSVLSHQLEQAYPDSNKEVGFAAFPLWKSPFGGQGEFRPVLRILIAVAIGLFLIVVVNIANLLLARATARQREISIRLALGAGRFRLIRQLLTESLLLALAGGALGTLLASQAVKAFSLLIPKGDLPFGYDFRLTTGTVAATCLLTAGAAVVFGLAPAIQGARGGLSHSLKEKAGGSGAGTGRQRFRSFLVISEVALALVLLTGAGLCIKGFERARKVDIGFDPNNVLCAQLSLVANRYTPEKGKIFDRQLQQRLSEIPGVVDVGLSAAMPLGFSGVPSAAVEVEGYIPSPGEDRLASILMVSPRFLDTMKVPILEGRDFTDQDDPSRPNVAIINQTMALRFWPGRDPIGRQFRMAVGVAATDAFTVIGVAADGKYSELSEPPSPGVYLAYQQRPLASLFMGVAMRTRGDPQSFVAALREEIHRLDPGVEPLNIQTMNQYIEPAFESVRIAALLLALLGPMAMMLSALGLYGVMSFMVSRRSREIGVRMALGADSTNVQRMVIRQGMTLVAIGSGIGLLATFGMSGLLRGFLYGASPADPTTFASVFALLTFVSLLACWLPAWRASRVDPNIALHSE